MGKDEDRVEFYEQLCKCKTKQEIEDLIDIISNIDLYEIMLDKYNQAIKYNKRKNDGQLVKDIIVILEDAYLKFSKR